MKMDTRLQTKLLVTGIVQGVGFRPFCVRTALALGLCGTVRNTSGGVEIVLEGDDARVSEYLRVLWEEHPSAAAVHNIEIRHATVARPMFTTFSVSESLKSEEQRVLIPSDLAVCEQCLSEMNDPENRRFRYPFVNCTVCGPRYTLIRALPYDRPLTTMKDFPMCADCEREYHDPADRRYHAQPNACPVCGPQVWLIDAAGRKIGEQEAAMERMFFEIASGRLVAVKGIGGFHIACLPTDAPLAELRSRKHRPDKPFALMVRDIETAKRLVDISSEAERLLTGVQRPIVLCPAKSGRSYKGGSFALSPRVAPGQKRLGIMLPYAPLHHLIMEKFEVLVMTSANRSDAPIVSSNEDAFAVLAGVVDFILCHNRDIHTAIDDSVVLPVESGSVCFRRARGYVPNPIFLPFNKTPDILAAGAQLKSTYALVRGREKTLFPGQYLGDLDQLGTAIYYKRSLEHFMSLYEIKPEVLAFDKHPNYVATDLAKAFCKTDVTLYPVQHHHAHLASVLLDNRFHDTVIGVIFDGTGYGDDGTVWGGEFLVGDIRDFKRAGSLLPCRLPGGERAIREPWRYGLALLNQTFGFEDAQKIARKLWPEFQNWIDPVLSVMSVAPETTSCGRLFDGVAALLNLCPTATYDGQAAMTLENSADEAESEDFLNFEVREGDGFIHLDWRDAVRSVVASGKTKEKRAAMFHRGLARSVADICLLIKGQTAVGHVALSGGVWQNALLRRLTSQELAKRGFVVLCHRDISPNDEGVSVGQAAVAAYNCNRSAP